MFRLPRFRQRFAIVSATLLILGVSLFPIMGNHTASAWTGSLGTCSNTPDYTTALQSDERWNVDKTSFIVFCRDWSGPPLYGGTALVVVWDVETETNRIIISGNESDGSAQLYLPITGNVNTYTIQGDGSLSPVSISDGNGWGPADINCISAARLVTYDPSFSGTTYPDPVIPGGGDNGGDIDAPPSEPCDWWDLVCVAQKIYLSIKGFFTSFPTKLSEAITDIFGPVIEALVPGADDNSIFIDGYNNVKSYMEAKLGFLTYPFTWISSFVGNIQAITWTGSFAPSCIYNSQGLGIWSYCTLPIGELFGTDTGFDLGFMEREFPSLWNTVIIFVRFVFLIGIIEMLRRAYFRTVRT